MPLPSKRNYDIASWLVTQLTFSFAVAPFLILSLSGSLQAWGRVYFYGVIGTAAMTAFFASPARGHLRRALERRAAKAGGRSVNGKAAGPAKPPARSASSDSLSSVSREPVMGITQDLEKEFDEVVSEIRERKAAS